VNLASVRLAKGDDARIETVYQCAKRHEIERAIGPNLQAIFHFSLLHIFSASQKVHRILTQAFGFFRPRALVHLHASGHNHIPMNSSDLFDLSDEAAVMIGGTSALGGAIVLFESCSD